MKTSIKSCKFRYLTVVLGYVILAIIITWPVTLNINSQLAGSGNHSHMVINIITHSLSEFTGINDVLSDLASNLRFDSLSTDIYASYLLGFPLGYNIAWLLSLIISAYGAFALTRYLIRNSLAKDNSTNSQNISLDLPAFIAGIIYAFNPLHLTWASKFSGSGHIELIPLATLFVLKFFKKPNLKYLVLSTLFLVLIFRGDFHYALVYLVFIAILSAYYLYRNRKIFNNRLSKSLLTALVLIFSSLSIWLFVSINPSALASEAMFNQTVGNSNDALGIIVPVFGQRLWNSSVPEGIDYPAFLGLVAMLLTIPVLIFRKSREPLVWFLLSIGFFVLSLGPLLHFAGFVRPRIPLPYLLVYHYLPTFQSFVLVDSFAVVSMLCSAVVAGYGLYYLVKKFSRSFPFSINYRFKNNEGLVTSHTILAVIVICLLIFEYSAVKTPTTALTGPLFQNQIRSQVSKNLRETELVSYRLNGNSDNLAPIIKKETNWQAIETVDGQRLEEINDRAIINLNNIFNEEDLTLSFQTKTLSPSHRILKIELNESRISEFIIDDTLRYYSTILPNLNTAENEIKFKIFDLYRKPLYEVEEQTVVFYDLSIDTPNTEIRNTYQGLGNDNSNINVLQIPFHSFYDYFDSKNKKILSLKDFGRTDPYTNKISFETELPFYKELLFKRNLEKTSLFFSNEAFDPDYYQTLWNYNLNQSGVSHIVIHKNLLTSAQLANLTGYLESKLAIKNKKETDQLLIYQITSVQTEDAPIMTLGEGWLIDNSYSYADQVKQMSHESLVVINNPFNKNLPGELSFQVRSCPNITRQLDVYHNYILTDQLKISWDEFNNQSILLNLFPDQNVILLKLLDEDGKYFDGEDIKRCPLWFADLSFNYQTDL